MPKKVLLADDSVTIRKVVELTFADTDIRVDAVASGAEALERFRAAPPDLVLADVVMPGPDGYDLCRRVKESDERVPVILLAGTFEPFDPERARLCGADGHLVKPFESRVLLDRVERLLAAGGSVSAAGEEGEVEEVFGEIDSPFPEPGAFPEESAEASGVVEGPPRDEPLPPAGAHHPEEHLGAPAIVAVEPDPVEPDDATRAGEEPDGAKTVAEARRGGEALGPEPAILAAEPPEETRDETVSPGGDAGPAREGGPTAGSPERSAVISDAEIDEIARRVVERLSERVVREIAWDVVPDLAEIAVRERLRQLEREDEDRT